MRLKKRFCLFCLLGILLFFWGVAVLRQNRMVQFSPGGETVSIVLKLDNKVEEIRSWYDEEKDLHYFFLPSCVPNGKIYCDDIGDGMFMIDDRLMKKGGRLSWEEGKIYIFKTDLWTCRVTFMKSKNIPAFFMETDSSNMDYVYADKHNEEKGRLTVVDADRALQYCGSLDKISLRGNTTVMQEKKPYGIELSRQASLCGMDSGRNWKLLALYFEQDKIHSKLIFDMAREIGLSYTPDSSWVDLYCNGEYQGLYLLTEAVTSNLGKEDGYLFEKTNRMQVEPNEISFSTNLNYLFKMKKPAFLTQSQTEELADRVQQIETLIVTGDTQYREYIDIESLAKQFLIDKIVQEADAMALSTFFCLKNGKLYAGPLWDYDRAIGETFPDYEIPIEGEPNGMAEWYLTLYRDEEFFHVMKEAYLELLPYCKQLMQEGIDRYVELVRASVAMDSVLMEKYETPLGMTDLRSYTEYESYIRYLKYFLANRLNYLNHLWGITDVDFEVPASTGEYHTVIFQREDGMIVDVREVTDGMCIEDLPVLSGADSTEWYFSCRDWGNDKSYHSKIPVYEDMVLYGSGN